jgi:phosphatidylglycerol:prolipoprotein diacylglycerol transferase
VWTGADVVPLVHNPPRFAWARRRPVYIEPVIELPFAGDARVHGLFTGLGIAAALAFFAHEKRRQELSDPRLWTLAGLALTFGAIGSRLLTWDFDAQMTVAEWWIAGDRSILAGLVGAWAGVLLGKRLTGYRARTGDLFAPAVALAIAVGRIGCLLTEYPGTPTGGGWGIVLAPDQAAVLGGIAGVGLHPSFAYEIVFQFAAFVVLWRCRDRAPRSGDLFLCYVAAYALFRFGVEFVRGNDTLWLGMSGPQWFLLAVLPLMARRVRRILAGHVPAEPEGRAA